MSIYHNIHVVAALQEMLQGYYIKLNSRDDWTIEDVKTMLEDDLKTLREWNGEDILNQIKYDL